MLRTPMDDSSQLPKEDSSRSALHMQPFVCVRVASAASPAPTDPSIKKAVLRAAPRKGEGSFCGHTPFAVEAADAAKPHAYVRVYTTCLDESSDLAKVLSTPHG